jgi:small-conductance mechanosensitive channel
MVLKRVGPLPCAKITGTLYAILGLIIGCVFSLVALASEMISQTPASGRFAGVMGVGSIVIFPILYGIVGFVSTLFAAWLYNVLAGFVGGVEVELE